MTPCGQKPPHWRGRDDNNWEPVFNAAIRNSCPAGRDGYVANDVDFVIRLFGPNYNTDADGKFMLTEFKHYPSGLTVSQKKLFTMMDRALRAGDCQDFGCQYMGFYLVQFEVDCWVDCGKEHKYWLNGLEMDLATMMEWMCGNLVVEAEPLYKEPVVYNGWSDLR